MSMSANNSSKQAENKDDAKTSCCGDSCSPAESQAPVTAEQQHDVVVRYGLVPSQRIYTRVYTPENGSSKFK